MNAKRVLGFTFIELQLVIAILAAMLLPTLEHATGKAETANRVNDFKQLQKSYAVCPGEDTRRLV
jgi:type II secretory pathway pseudopilin PulG